MDEKYREIIFMETKYDQLEQSFILLQHQSKVARQEFAKEFKAQSDLYEKQLNELKDEIEEQSRLNGMGGSREAKLMGIVSRQDKKLNIYREALENIISHMGIISSSGIIFAIVHRIAKEALASGESK